MAEGLACEAIAITVHMLPIRRIPARYVLATSPARLIASRKMLIGRPVLDQGIQFSASRRIRGKRIERGSQHDRKDHTRLQ